MSDDNEKTLELTRRRALGGLLTIGVGSAAVGAGTLAAFSDEESSTGNQVTAGTLDLGSTSGGAFSADDLAPGEQTDEFTITTDYTGSIDADVELEFSLSNPSNENTISDSDASESVTPTEFAEQLDVDTADYTISNSGNSNTQNLESSGVTADNLADGSYSLGTVSDGATIAVDLQFTFQDVSDNKFQDDGVVFELTFSAEQ
jgi:spore coat-associated protein N